jgi:hypothetical protein
MRMASRDSMRTGAAATRYSTGPTDSRPTNDGRPSSRMARYASLGVRVGRRPEAKRFRSLDASRPAPSNTLTSCAITRLSQTTMLSSMFGKAARPRT